MTVELPASVTAADIERYLDRVALAIAESPHGEKYLCIYEWLEGELERRRQMKGTMAAVLERVRRSSGRTAGRSLPARRAAT